MFCPFLKDQNSIFNPSHFPGSGHAHPFKPTGAESHLKSIPTATPIKVYQPADGQPKEEFILFTNPDKTQTVISPTRGDRYEVITDKAQVTAYADRVAKIEGGEGVRTAPHAVANPKELPVHAGMTEAEVKAKLGEPDDTTSSDEGEI